MKNIDQMRSDALEIFKAGIRSVEPGYAIRRYCHVENGRLFIDNTEYDVSKFQNIYVSAVASAPPCALQRQ